MNQMQDRSALDGTVIRTGLIRNRDGVAREAFERHWLDVHGPLARIVPEMRAYVQNHIVARHPIAQPAPFHRIDGLSQLWFDDVPAMARGMTSPEQQACIEDIKGFLSEVTIVIQKQGKLISIGDDPCATAQKMKLMTVLVGNPGAVDAYTDEIVESLSRRAAPATQLRVNPVIDRNYIVDSGVARGEQVVAAIGEVWFNTDNELKEAFRGGVFEQSAHILQPAAAMTVREYRLL